MRGLILGSLITLALLSVSLGADPVTPESPQLERYQPLWVNPMFGKASAKDASETYTLVSFFKIGNVSYATLIEKQSGRKFCISSDTAPSADPSSDISLISTDPSTDVLSSSVTIQKDGEQMIVKFDPKTAKAAPTSATPTATNPQNGPGAFPPGREFFRNFFRRNRMINNQPGENNAPAPGDFPFGGGPFGPPPQQQPQ